MVRFLWCLVGVCSLLTAVASGADRACAPLRVEEARPDEVMNAHFVRTDGWIGSDAILSIPLPDETTLWVFGDTLVGQVREGRRHQLSMVNNSFAKQRGWGAASTVELFLHRDAAGQPATFVVPEGKPGYFWLWDGIVEQGTLALFATRLTSPGTITAFDWKLLDQSLILVENPLDDPAQWKIRQRDLPFGVFTDDYEVIWGMEVLRVGDFLYIYGTARHKAGDPRSLVVARVLPTDLANFERWEFFRDGEWQPDPRKASSLTTGVGTEGSITWLPARSRYVYVYSPPLDPHIRMRTAASPLGPWSDPVSIYECPEAQWDRRIFCYAGKARLVPGTRDELLISYATNSFEMLPHVTEDARIYMPRFVRARVTE